MFETAPRNPAKTRQPNQSAGELETALHNRDQIAGELETALRNAKVNIEYLYCATSPRSKKGLLVLRVNKVKKALKALGNS